MHSRVDVGYVGKLRFVLLLGPGSASQDRQPAYPGATVYAASRLRIPRYASYSSSNDRVPCMKLVVVGTGDVGLVTAATLAAIRHAAVGLDGTGPTPTHGPV